MNIWRYSNREGEGGQGRERERERAQQEISLAKASSTVWYTRIHHWDTREQKANVRHRYCHHQYGKMACPKPQLRTVVGRGRGEGARERYSGERRFLMWGNGRQRRALARLRGRYRTVDFCMTTRGGFSLIQQHCRPLLLFHRLEVQQWRTHQFGVRQKGAKSPCWN